MKPSCAVALAVLLSGCATQPSTPAAGRTVAYDCERGDRILVTYSATGDTATLARGGSTVALPRQPAASGFAYGAGPTTLRGKDDDVLLGIGRMVPIRCTATR